MEVNRKGTFLGGRKFLQTSIVFDKIVGLQLVATVFLTRSVVKDNKCAQKAIVLFIQTMWGLK